MRPPPARMPGTSRHARDDARLAARRRESPRARAHGSGARRRAKTSAKRYPRSRRPARPRASVHRGDRHEPAMPHATTSAMRRLAADAPGSRSTCGRGRRSSPDELRRRAGASRCRRCRGCARCECGRRGRAISAMAALCVMTAVVVPSSRFTRSSTSRTRRPVWKSSAPVGSSQSRTSGRLATARAMATRCCSPPESCAGKWSTRSPRPDQRERLLGSHRVVGDVGDQRDVLARGEARDEVVELEDEARRARGGSAVSSSSSGAREVVVAEATRPLVGDVETAEDVEQRGLAAAGGAEQHHELAGEEIEDDAAQRDHLDVAHTVDLREVRIRKMASATTNPRGTGR